MCRKHFEGLKPNIDNGFWKMGGEFFPSSRVKAFDRKEADENRGAA